MHESKSQTIKWLLLWLVTWGVSQSLWGGDPLKPTSVPGTILIIFLIAIVLAFVLFPEQRRKWLSRISSLEIPVILLSIAIFSSLDQRLLVSNLLTSTHVLFQQFMIAVLVFMPPSEKFSQVFWRVLIFFGASHLFLAFFMSWSWTLLFTVLATAIATAFAFLIQRVKHGITISFLIHLSFYLIFFALI
ncbi:MAG: hypothetical protein Q8R34_01940 [bacterium]|nr:hypothetical protein [bacterium]